MFLALSVDARTWFNEELESRNFIVPGVVAIVMAVIGTFLTSLTIAREWERGTMEQLISTPVSPLEVIVGKLVPYFIIGMADAAVCVMIAVWWFEVPLRGSLLVLGGASALFMAAVLLMGFFISVVAGSQLAASQFSLLITFLPSFLLSGFAFPIDQMPLAVRLFTFLIPARLLRGYLEGGIPQGLRFCGQRDPVHRPGFVHHRRRHHGGAILQKEFVSMKESFHRIWQLIVKEFIQVLRDPRARFSLIAPPIVQMLIFGYAASFEVRHVTTAILDLDHSQESRELISRFWASDYFDITAEPRQSGEIATSSIAAKSHSRFILCPGLPKICARGRPRASR